MSHSCAVWMGSAVQGFHIVYLEQAGPWADPSKRWRFWTGGKLAGEPHETVNEEGSALVVGPSLTWNMLLTGQE